MTSYFDEHNCEPLNENETPNHQLHLARLLIDTGIASFDTEFERLFGGRVPPASKEVVSNLPTKHIHENHPNIGKKCPICLGTYTVDEEVKELPCIHCFHSSCILPWLARVNTCPVCRHELPTDDADYEAVRKQRARQKERELELQALHDSMFG